MRLPLLAAVLVLVAGEDDRIFLAPSPNASLRVAIDGQARVFGHSRSAPAAAIDAAASRFCERHGVPRSAGCSRHIARQWRGITSKRGSECRPLEDPELLLSGKTSGFLNDEQDEWLERYLFRGRTHGVFVEAGASFVATSLTHMFEANRCWRGLAVEPDARAAQSLRRTRPTTTIAHAALCGRHGGTRAYWHSPSHPTLSNTQGAHVLASDWRSAGERQEKTTVPCIEASTAIQLAGLVGEAPPRPPAGGPVTGSEGAAGAFAVDLFVLDCQGCETEVLKAFDFEAVPVEVLLVAESGNDRKWLAAHLAARDFVLVACVADEDLVFVHARSPTLRVKGGDGAAAVLRTIPREPCCHKFVDEDVVPHNCRPHGLVLLRVEADGIVSPQTEQRPRRPR